MTWNFKIKNHILNGAFYGFTIFSLSTALIFFIIARWRLFDFLFLCHGDSCEFLGGIGLIIRLIIYTPLISTGLGIILALIFKGRVLKIILIIGAAAVLFILLLHVLNAVLPVPIKAQSVCKYGVMESPYIYICQTAIKFGPFICNFWPSDFKDQCIIENIMAIGDLSECEKAKFETYEVTNHCLWKVENSLKTIKN